MMHNGAIGLQLIAAICLSVAVQVHGAPGAKKWEFTATGSISGSPALGPDGTVYFGSSDGPSATVYALDGSNGVKKWSASVGSGGITSPALGTDGTVYVGSAGRFSGDGSLDALNGTNGTLRWLLNMGSAINSSPAIGADGTVFFGSSSAGVIAVNGVTGIKKWEFKTDSAVNASPAIGADGTVYIGSNSKSFFALDGDTGALRWEFRARDLISSSPALGAGGTVFITSNDGNVYALDGATGRKLWETLINPATSPVLSPAGLLYLVDARYSWRTATDQNLYALDAVNGSRLWQSWIGRSQRYYGLTPAVAADGTVYVGNGLHAFDGTTGAQKWAFADAAVYSPPAIGPDGTIYFGSNDGKLYALEGTVGLASNVWSKFRGNERNTGSREIAGPPVIVSFAPNAEAVADRAITLAAIVGGTRPLSYQWFFNDQPIADGTNAKLALAEAQLTNAGQYSFTVSNAFGSGRSGAARIAVGYALDLLTLGSGTVRRNPNREVYAPGATVELTALPDGTRHFERWSGDAASTNNPLVVTLTGNLKVIAKFELVPGEKIWEFQTGNGVLSCPAVGPDGTIYFGSSVNQPDTKVYAVDGRTGEKKWEFSRVNGSDSSPSLGPDGTLYIGSGAGDNKLYALDAATGQLRWKFDAGAEVSSSPAVGADGKVYFGKGAKSLFAVNATNGALVWQYHADASVGSPAVGVDGTVYCGSQDSYVYAVGGGSGQMRWKFKAGGSVLSSPAIDASGTIYIGSSDSKLYALDGLSGARQWEFQARAPVNGSPVIGNDGLVFVTSDDGWLYAVDTSTRLEKWRANFAYSGFGVAPALGADGSVYAVNNNGGLLALDSATGAERWTYSYGFSLRSAPALASDGKVLLGTDRGIIAVKANSELGLASRAWPKLHSDSGNTGSRQIIGPPVILKQPVAVEFAAATPVTLQALVGGKPPFNYQWYFNGQPITGATNAELAFTQIQLTNAGAYSVSVSNAFGSAASTNANVSVGYTLETNTEGLGIVKRLPDQTIYAPNAPVELTAIAEAGRPFLEWSGDIIGSTNPVTVIMTGSKEVTAHFTLLLGDKRWEFVTAGVVRSSPAVGTNGTIYFGSGDHKIYAVDGATGRQKWQYLTGDQVLSSPAIGPDDTIYFGSSDGKVYALDGVTGVTKWSFQAADVVYSSPAIGTNGLVYATSASGTAVALDAGTGSKKWQFVLNSYGVYSSPAISADGTVYFGGGWDNKLYALHGDTGKLKWQFVATNAIQSSPALGPDGTVYFGSSDKKVYALDGDSGRKEWERLVGDSVTSSPALGPDGTLYVGANDGFLYALDAATGAQKWTFLTGDTIHSSPAVGADGTVYFGSYDKNIYALDGATGAEKWEFTTGGLVLSSPMVTAEGSVYIGSNDGKLYALKGGSGLATNGWPAFRGNLRHTGSAEIGEAAIPVVLRYAELTTAGFRVNVQTSAGKTYLLEFKNSLSENTWTPVSVVAGDGASQALADPGPPGPQRFYRVRVE